MWDWTQAPGVRVLTIRPPGNSLQWFLKGVCASQNVKDICFNWFWLRQWDKGNISIQISQKQSFEFCVSGVCVCVCLQILFYFGTIVVFWFFFCCCFLKCLDSLLSPHQHGSCGASGGVQVWLLGGVGRLRRCDQGVGAGICLVTGFWHPPSSSFLKRKLVLPQHVITQEVGMFFPRCPPSSSLPHVLPLSASPSTLPECFALP